MFRGASCSSPICNKLASSKMKNERGVVGGSGEADSKVDESDLKVKRTKKVAVNRPLLFLSYGQY
jgi:hypothetical protein